MSLVKEIFLRHGFYGFRIGTETDDKRCWELLSMQSDPTSLMLRFRPDLLQIKPRARTVLCEVKSEAKGYQNFAVEFDSWMSSIMWNRSGHHVMYAFVDLSRESVSACWADDIPRPFIVRVPRRQNWEKHVSRLKQEAPWAQLQLVPYTNGSGTPYFLLHKEIKCLQPLEYFIRVHLISW
jgi:hypothetical protein